jgi:hypothetical protein
MNHLLQSIRQISGPRTFEREIAPGITVHVRKPRRSLKFKPTGPLSALTSRMHDVWDVLRGKGRASAKASIQERLRRAA